MVVDEVEARPGRLVAARQGDLSPVEGVEALVVRGRVRHPRGDHDAVAVVERDEARSCSAFSKRPFDDMSRSLGVAAAQDLIWLAVSRAGMSMPVRQQVPP